MDQHLIGTKGYLILKLKSCSLYPLVTQFFLEAIFLNSYVFFQGRFMNMHANIFIYTHIHIYLYIYVDICKHVAIVYMYIYTCMSVYLYI